MMAVRDMLQTGPDPSTNGRAPAPSRRSRVIPGFVLLIVTGLSGCASHYDRVWLAREEFHAGRLDVARQTVDKQLKRHKSDADVFLLDKAMIELASGNPKEAEQILRGVRDRFDEFEQKDVGEMTMSMLTDDTARSYAGEDYEKVLIRAMLALANLMHDGGDAEAYSLQTIDKQEQIIAAGATKEGENPKLAYQRVALAPYLRGVLREATHLDYDDAERSFVTVCNWQPEFAAGKFDLERAARGTHSTAFCMYSRLSAAGRIRSRQSKSPARRPF
jgi:hypothetical protein